MRNYLSEFGQYENFISLGYFCGVAEDLEELGLRDASSPFDWTITSFMGVIRAMETSFEGFMERDNMIQNVKLRQCYMDVRYGIVFYHDFSKYRTMESQYDEVREKYQRRITRFLKRIEAPTLFFRYISNEDHDGTGRSIELKWIEENNDYINGVIKKHNPANRIIYLGDENTRSDVIEIYHVAPKGDDCVSRKPIINNEELKDIIPWLDLPGKKKNVERFEKKQKSRNQIVSKCKRKLEELYHERFTKVIIHDREYDRFDRFGG